MHYIHNYVIYCVLYFQDIAEFDNEIRSHPDDENSETQESRPTDEL